MPCFLQQFTQPLLTFYPVPTPFPFPFPFHSTVTNLVSDLFSSPSFSLSTNARSFAAHSFSRPPFLIPIVGCTNLFYLPRFTARAGTRLLLSDLALSHRLVDGATYWLFSLQHTVIMEKGKVVRCVCVCGTRVCGFYWGKAMERRIEWFWMGWDGREERAGVFCSNVMIVLIDCAD